MNTEGQVGVELRLVMDQLRKDVKQAAEMLRTSLGTGAEGAAASTDKAVKKMENLEKQTRKTTRALEEMKRQRATMDAAWRKDMGVPDVPRIIDASMGGGYKPTLNHIGQTFTNLGERSGANAIAQWQANMRAYHRSVSAARNQQPPPPPPNVNPPPGFTPIIGSGITYGGGWGPGGGAGGGVGGGAGGGWGGSRLAVAAQLGAALAGLRAAVGLVQFAFEKLLSPIRAIIAVSEAASRMWARAARSGVGLGVTVQRSVLSSVMGVGEDEVYRYASAFTFLNSRLAESMRAIHDTTIPLTELSWSYKSLKVDIAGLAATITTVLAPAIKEAQDGIGQGVQRTTKHMSDFMRNQQAISFAEKHGLESVTKRIKDPEGRTAREVLVGFRRLLFDGKGEDPKSALFMKMFEKMLGDKAASSPASLAAGSANRMAASAWERMGLIVGPGPAADAGRETARNTRRMVWLLEKIVGASGAPRGGYGSNPLTSSA